MAWHGVCPAEKRSVSDWHILAHVTCQLGTLHAFGTLVDNLWMKFIFTSQVVAAQGFATLLGMLALALGMILAICRGKSDQRLSSG